MSKFVILDEPISGDGPHISFPMGVDDYKARYQAAHLPVGAVTSWAGSPRGAPLTMIEPGPSRISRGTLGGVPFVRSPGSPTAGGRLLGPHLQDRPFTVAAVLMAEQASTPQILGVSLGVASVTADPVWSLNLGGQTVYTSQGAIGKWVSVVIQVTAENRLRYRVATDERVSTGTVTAPPTASGGIFFGSSSAKPAMAAEILYWDRELTKAERDTFHAYAQGRYGAL